jgi:NADH-quinone oxidoreductase subunit L
VPLAVLAIPSLIIGALLVGPMLFRGYFGESIYVAPAHDVLGKMGEHYHGVLGFTLHAFGAPPVYLAFAGIFIAWLCYIRYPALPGRLAERFSVVYTILVRKYGVDELYQWLFAGGARGAGRVLWQIGDVRVIDGALVNGTAAGVRWFSGLVRTLQSGYLYDYAFAMIIGLLLLLALFLRQFF